MTKGKRYDHRSPLKTLHAKTSVSCLSLSHFNGCSFVPSSCFPCVHIYVYVYICICIYLCVYMPICIYVCVYVCIHHNNNNIIYMTIYTFYISHVSVVFLYFIYTCVIMSLFSVLVLFLFLFLFLYVCLLCLLCPCLDGINPLLFSIQGSL